ncbi:MAG: KH domain-containing protein [bacterium]|nr:KH domain-containing protein [bacterium]
MQEFLQFLITPLLAEPDQLNVKSSAYNVSISIATADMGKVIGKGGTIISAIRNLVRTYCVTHQLPFTTVTLAEPLPGK